MPYIKKEKRPVLDEIIDDAEFDLVPDGRLNYFLFKLMLCRRRIEGESYQFYKNYCAELRACAREIERRYMNKYESQKINQNGDVEE
jgi:hypothetical protein